MSKPRAGKTGPRIATIGTGDTKSDELLFIRDRIQRAGGEPVMVDVSVLGDPPYTVEHDKHAVASAAETTIGEMVNSGDENTSMTLMATGCARLVRRLYDDGKVDAMLALGGSMGTDLALDVALALPLGVPKFVVSTIAYSHLIPPERIAPDLMMILWAGGLFGLNSTCQAVLSQACGAVVGASTTWVAAVPERPVVAMSSLGKSCLKYMTTLKPELERRGYEVVVFHTTGMGGRALEAIAAQRGFVAVMDFSLQELANDLTGSVVTSGPSRLESAGQAAIPQIVAPGAVDMVDFPAWQGIPQRLRGRPYHAHNRLLASVTSGTSDRRRIARSIGERLRRAQGPVAFILPTGGLQEWDQPGEPLHDPEGLEAFLDEMRGSVGEPVQVHEIAGHINGREFIDTALAIFDRWAAEGVIPPGRPSGATA
ncbi:MAG TPA: Tm-1-like ATP-binding domain-containing protein [Gammaproteobacteria bacterium]|nr:Tm-1-like ATP-binding domain-containing protein [Gammaproteobacteria bacterium]